MDAINVIVSGRVQMVMYRAHVQGAAHRLGIVGEVENLTDGTVRIHAEGERTRLEELIEELKRGSWLSKVENVAVTWTEPSGRYTEFSIRYS